MRKDFMQVCMDKNLWRFESELVMSSVNLRKRHLFNMELKIEKCRQFGGDLMKHAKGINPYWLLIQAPEIDEEHPHYKAYIA